MADRKILIVDDDKDLLRALGIRLINSGYKFIVATDVVSAVSIAQKQNPDLIILDIGLPGGDGFMVMERLKSLNPDTPIPIIILSALDPYANRERALNAGALAFFQKPADNQELLSAIKKALEETHEYKQEKMKKYS